MIKNILAFGLLFLLVNTVRAQIFYQPFSSYSTVNEYSDPAGAPNHFTSIGSTTGTTLSLNSEKLFFEREYGGMGWLARTADFLPLPDAIMIRFQLQVVQSGGAETSACVFRVGDSFTDTSEPPATPLANTWARFGINFLASSNQFQLRNISSGTNSSIFTGEKTICWVINSSGSPLTYTAPNGTECTLANNTYDLWVDTMKVQNAISAVSPGVSLNNFKFIFNPSKDGARISVDEFEISDPRNSPLPLDFYSLHAELTNDGQLSMSWKCNQKSLQGEFIIENSLDGQYFETLGFCKAVLGRQHYTWLGPIPFQRNYFRLRYKSEVNVFHNSPVIYVNTKDVFLPIIKQILPEGIILIESDLEITEIKAYTVLGKEVNCTLRESSEGTIVNIPLDNPKEIIILRLLTKNHQHFTIKCVLPFM